MFTGIIEEVGEVVRVDDLGGGKRLTIRAAMSGEVRVDESVAVNGACQTVVAHDRRTFSVVAIEETLRKTALGQLRTGTPVNLERAMQLGARLDGHLVQGHVDGLGVITGVEQETSSWRYTVRFPEAFAPYLIPVGSITVDGISLTVARLADHTFTVAIIPHTYEHTNVPTWQVGSRVNLEFDLIGKYVARHLAHLRPNADSSAPAVTETGYAERWLREMGLGG